MYSGATVQRAEEDLDPALVVNARHGEYLAEDASRSCGNDVSLKQSSVFLDEITIGRSNTACAYCAIV